MNIEWNKVTWYSKLGALIVLVITVSLGFYFWSEYQEIQVLKNSKSNQQVVVPTPTPVTGELTIRGQVTDIDVTPMFVDGDGILKVTTDKGEIFTILIPARERLCEADISSFSNLSIGSEVEAFGSFMNTTTTLCESPDHYLKIIEDSEVDTSDWQTYTNEEFGFEVKYPAESFSLVPADGVYLNLRLRMRETTYYDASKLIRPQAAQDILDKKECWYGEVGGPLPCDADSEDGIGFVVTDTSISEYDWLIESEEAAERISLSGREGIKYRTGVEGYNIDYYLIPLTQNSTLTITKDWTTLESQQGERRDTVPEFNQILSTFRFIE